ncbi:MAG: rhodanese-like domain-containing protein [Deltaproteobacteria bacterium]|nr:rhodanese-like domain-containing protein [Deltaproteobacteria bacterium]
MPTKAMHAHPSTAEVDLRPARQTMTDSPCCFLELSPNEFNAMKQALVAVFKHAQAVAEFHGFYKVVAVDTCQELEMLLAKEPTGTPVALVCADGEYSARVALRLAQQGRRPIHLSGGLLEWRRGGGSGGHG